MYIVHPARTIMIMYVYNTVKRQYWIKIMWSKDKKSVYKLQLHVQEGNLACTTVNKFMNRKGTMYSTVYTTKYVYVQDENHVQ